MIAHDQIVDLQALQYLTVADAAIAYGVSKLTVRNWIRASPDLRVRPAGYPLRRTLIDRERLKAWAAGRRDRRERNLRRLRLMALYRGKATLESRLDECRRKIQEIERDGSIAP